MRMLNTRVFPIVLAACGSRAEKRVQREKKKTPARARARVCARLVVTSSARDLSARVCTCGRVSERDGGEKENRAKKKKKKTRTDESASVRFA